MPREPAPSFNARAYCLDRYWRRLLRRHLLLFAWHRYQWGRARVAYLPALARTSAKDRKPLGFIVLDLTLLTVRWRCIPVHYLRYGLYRVGQPRRHLFRYLPETVLYYRLLPRASADEILLDDKDVTKAMLSSAGIRSPRTVGHVRRRHLKWSQEALPKNGCVIKPQRHSSGGNGVDLVVSVPGGLLRTSEGRLLDLTAVADPSILEERIAPSPETAQWGAGGRLNTFRIYTLTSRVDGISVVGALLKVGLGKSIVDNAHAGGIYVRADLQAERLLGNGVDERMAVHVVDPATGRAFSDAPIPGLQRVGAVAEAAAAAFPETPFIGWDIALDQNRNPVVIEGNSSPGLTPLQRTHGGMAPTLGRTLQAGGHR